MEEMRVLIALGTLLAAGRSGAHVIFGDCGSEYNLQSVSIEGCQMSLPCFLTVGEDPKVTVAFTAGFASRHLDQDVVITLNFVNQRTEVTPEPCASTGCPVSTQRATTIRSKMFIPRSMALNQRGTLRWRVYNESNRLVLCYDVLVQTQSPLQKALRQLLGGGEVHTSAQEDIVLDLG